MAPVKAVHLFALCGLLRADRPDADGCHLTAATEDISLASPWDRAIAGLRRRQCTPDERGIWKCPKCGKASLWLAVEGGLVNVRCFRGCELRAIVELIELAEPDLVPVLADAIRRERANGHDADGALRDLGTLGFSGDRLRATRERPRAESPMPGFLDPEPHLHIVLGKPKTAKTTLCLAIAQAWAERSEPWPGARALPGGRVLVISREQVLTRLDSTLRRLAVHAGRRDSATWEDRSALVARDSELVHDAKCLLTLDDVGLRALKAGLAVARDSGDPFSLVILDSLSRLKPPDVEERDNDGLTHWLDELEAIATHFGVWILLVHHVGHSAEADRREARSAGRGASAIAAVAQVVWLLERVPSDPRLRRLEVDGNAVLLAEHFLEVAPETAEPGEVLYFRPRDPLADYRADELLSDDEPITVSTLAWRLADKEPEVGKRPPGTELRLAAKLASTWERAALVYVTRGGPGRPTNVRLRRQ
jgi:hypothetical protein